MTTTAKFLTAVVLAYCMGWANGFEGGYRIGVPAGVHSVTALSIDRTNKVNFGPRRVNLNQ